ncbi:MAG: COQ9 family protein, partial [Proteobacteria bacterium]|nr:COQ9 family protein [Pseudomonadota bacterium]
GGVDAVLAYWAAESDRRMLAGLAKRDLESMRVRDRITAAVRVRLELNAKHREAIRMALTRAALPGRAPGAMRALWRTVDAMWRAAGDTATDYNFYTKRGLLVGVYASTLLYWLDDKSEGFDDTWAFLDRRIADVMRVPKAIGALKKCLPDPGRVLRVLRPRRAARG